MLLSITAALWLSVGGIYVSWVVAAPAVVSAVENNKDVFLLTYIHSTNECSWVCAAQFYGPQQHQQKN